MPGIGSNVKKPPARRGSTAYWTFTFLSQFPNEPGARMRTVLYRTCLRRAREPAGSAADTSSTLGGAVPSLGDLLPGILPGRPASLAFYQGGMLVEVTPAS